MQAQPGSGIEPYALQQHSGDTQVTQPMAAETSPRRLARIAGGLYLINIAGGLFALGYVPAVLVASGDAAATAHNIMAHQLLYRLALVVHIIICLSNIPLAVIFYDLFKVVNRRISLLVVFFTLVGTAIESATLLNQFAPLLLLQGDRYSSVFTAGQLQAQAYLPLELQPIGYSINAVFFGCYCLSIGSLIFRSSFLPRILGVILIIGGGCYLTSSFADFLSPAFAASLVPYIQLPSGVAELSLALWLLVVGVNDQRWKAQAGAATGISSGLKAGV
jgi:hypothetical protein